MKEKMKKLQEIKDCLVKAVEEEISHGVEHADTEEVYKVVDIIKDLAETERNCYEACYYKEVIKAMKEYDEDEENEDEDEYEDGRYGYRSSTRTGGNRGNRGNSGRGRGTTTPSSMYRMGFRPYLDQMPYIDGYLNDPDFEINMENHPMTPFGNRYGRAYESYKKSQKHYTMTKDQKDKEEMNAHANEHMANMIMTMKDIWREADQEQKRKMKNDLTSLLGEMN